MADGSVRRASADENPDLFWAIRGGGGNFGIAASLEFDAHPVGPMITGGLVAHPLQRGGDVLRVLPRAVCRGPGRADAGRRPAHRPGRLGRQAARASWPRTAGPLADGEAAVKPIKAFGPPVMDAMGPIPYCALNGLLDASLPKGALNYWKAQFLTDLSDDAHRHAGEGFEACPSPMSQIDHRALPRRGESRARRRHRLRDADHRLQRRHRLAVGRPADTDRSVAWCREMYAALQPYLGSMRYVNYLDDDEPGDPAAVAYGPNYPRLRELKKKYDPENFFHTNVNIRPL